MFDIKVCNIFNKFVGKKGNKSNKSPSSWKMNKFSSEIATLYLNIKH